MTAGVIDLDAAPRVAAARRPLAPLLLSLVLVLLLGASAPLRQPDPAATVPATFLDDMFIDGTRLFVVGPGGLLRIFRLPDAHPLGQMRIGSPGSISGVRQVGDVLLVMASGPRVTTAFDAGSGQELWSSGADLVAATADTVVLTDDLAIWAVDAHNGSVGWRVDQPTLGSRYLVTAGLDSMTSYDGQTGSPISSRKIHLSGIIYSYISEDRFVIGDSSGLSAYRLPALTPLWHVPADPREDRLEPGCVQVLCSYLGVQGVTVRDPATGRTLLEQFPMGGAHPARPGPGRNDHSHPARLRTPVPARPGHRRPSRRLRRLARGHRPRRHPPVRPPPGRHPERLLVRRTRPGPRIGPHPRPGPPRLRPLRRERGRTDLPPHRRLHRGLALQLTRFRAPGGATPGRARRAGLFRPAAGPARARSSRLGGCCRGGVS
ncbi:hypothetical protein [Actinoplanes sp. NPDC051411]|uniref:hypothetical protein n=1 Tax=Actinoplanes sp. NPDC051411 TaxID=3155522 RepID=UPI00341C41BB